MLTPEQEESLTRMAPETAARMRRIWEGAARWREEQKAKEAGYAVEQQGAAQPDGSGSARPEIREKGGHPAKRRKGIQRGRQAGGPQIAAEARQKEGLTCPEHREPMRPSNLYPGGWTCQKCWDEAHAYRRLGVPQSRNILTDRALGVCKQMKASPQILTAGQPLTPTATLLISQLMQAYDLYLRSLG